MRWVRWKRASVCLGVVVVAGLAAGGVFRRGRAEGPPQRAAAAGPNVPKAAGPGRILYGRDGALYETAPDGKGERRIDLPPGAGVSAVPSPDGKSVAYWIEPDEGERAELCVRRLDGKEAVTRLKLPPKIREIEFCWSPDGTELHVNTATPGLGGVQHLRVDVKAKTITPLDLLKTHLVTDWSRDGKYFLTTAVGGGEEWLPTGLHLMNRDGAEHRALAGPEGADLMSGRLSPDGKRILCRDSRRLVVMEVGKPASLRRVEGVPAGAEVGDFAWSPDGKRIAFTTSTSRLAGLEWRLVVAGADGKGARVIRSGKGEFITQVHWR